MELLTGRGFADYVFLPKPEYREDLPALLVELKWNKKAETALQQIKEKNTFRQYRITQERFCWLVLHMTKK